MIILNPRSIFAKGSKAVASYLNQDMARPNNLTLKQRY